MKGFKKNNIYIKAIGTKGLSVVVALFFILSTTTVVFGSTNIENNYKTKVKNFYFSGPSIEESGDFLQLKLNEAQSTLMKRGEPNLPVVKTVFYLPVNSKNIEVNYDLEKASIETMILDKKIAPAPAPIPLLAEQHNPLLEILSKFFYRKANFVSYENKIELDNEIYNLGVKYPTDFLDYRIGVGLYNGKLTKIIPVEFSPTQVQHEEKQTNVKYITGEISITVTYESSEILETPLNEEEQVDLLILAPKDYINGLRPLVEHKKEMGLKTKLVELGEIYAGDHFNVPNWTRDNQETIKHFIYEAKFKWNVTYIMVVGGYRTFFGLNRPNQQFPVRYSHLVLHEPGYVTDQYFSCFLKENNSDPRGYSFDTWDSNGNDRFAEFDEDKNIKDKIDPFPDIYFGRLACRNKIELRTIVDKIIYYEKNIYGEDWFNRMLSVTGDGFQDFGAWGAEPLRNTVEWDVSQIPTGKYTIYAQSELNANPLIKGPIDIVNLTVDLSQKSSIIFGEEDHLKIESLEDNQDTLYPAKPVAEITSPSEGDILGRTNIHYIPEEAYGAGNWAIVEYRNKIMKIRGKSYDPRPHDYIWNPTNWPIRSIDTLGSRTNLIVWVNNSAGETVLGPETVINLQCYWEGEIECEMGHHFMSDFNATRLWTSNGNWFCMQDVIDEFNNGYGFVYFAGHSNCISWGDHFPGIPGTRRNGQSNGIATINLRFGLPRYQAEENDPLLPMSKLKNKKQLPIVVMGGCHSGQYDTSLMKLLMDPYYVLFGDGYGSWAPEGIAWWMTRLRKGGAIAFIGYAGLGFGYYGVLNANKLSGWLNGEFFRKYSEEGFDILGAAFGEATSSYSSVFDTVDDDGNRKTFEEFVLLGDPSLKIGGYNPDEQAQNENDEDGTYQVSTASANLEINQIESNYGDKGEINITINNKGDTVHNVSYNISIESDDPLGIYIGGITKIFRGRIPRNGGPYIGTIENVTKGKSYFVLETKSFGLGFIKVNVTIDRETAIEDGFLIGRHLMLRHPEE